MATTGTESDRAADARPAEALSTSAARLGNKVLVSIGAGFPCGLVIGGVGGRIAMFVLRLTSNDAIRGRETDDGFEIGIISMSTMFLLIATAFLGAACGLLYLAARRFVPAHGRLLGSAVLFGLLGGAVILKPGEFDFTAVDPPLLSVVLFIAIPAAFGVALSWLAERMLRSMGEPKGWYPMIALLVLLFTGAVGAVVLVVLALGLVVANKSDAARRAWQSSAVLWSGRALLTALVVFLGVDTVQAATDII